MRDLNSRGQGVVAHPDGRVFFVSGVWPGEEGLFAVVDTRRRSPQARLLELLEASPHRVQPACPHHGFSDGECGGCPWQFMAYAAQLDAKQARVASVLTRLQADLSAQRIHGSPEIFGYRNRAQLKTDGRRLGFVGAGSQSLAPVDDCIVLNEHNRRTLCRLIARLPHRPWRPARRGEWTSLEIDDDTDAATVTPNTRRPFRQGNSAQNHYMRAWLSTALEDLAAEDPVLELFAGSGNFTDVLCDSGHQSVVAVDSFAPAVEALRARALPGVTAMCRNLDSADDAAALARVCADARILLLDPPRQGCRQLGVFLSGCRALHSMIYISCDLGTFTRDAETAIALGWRLKALQPLDLFPHTPHVEVLSAWEHPIGGAAAVRDTGAESRPGAKTR